MKAEEGTFYQPVTHSAGSLGDALTVYKPPRQKCGAAPEEELYMQMDGRGVFQFAVRRVPEVIGEVLEKNQVPIGDIDWFVLHQANRRIVEAVPKG